MSKPIDDDDDETDDEAEDKERQLHKGSIAEDFEEAEAEREVREEAMDSDSDPDEEKEKEKKEDKKQQKSGKESSDDGDIDFELESPVASMLASTVWEFQLAHDLTRDKKDQKLNWRPVRGDRVLVFEKGRGWVQGTVVDEQGLLTKEFTIAIKDAHGKDIKVKRPAQMEFGYVAYNYITPDLRPLKSSGRFLQDPATHLRWQSKLWHVDSAYSHNTPISTVVYVQGVQPSKGEFTYTYMYDTESDQPGHTFTGQLSRISRQRDDSVSVVPSQTFLPYTELTTGSGPNIALHPHTLQLEPLPGQARQEHKSLVRVADELSASTPLKLKVPSRMLSFASPPPPTSKPKLKSTPKKWDDGWTESLADFE